MFFKRSYHTENKTLKSIYVALILSSITSSAASTLLLSWRMIPCDIIIKVIRRNFKASNSKSSNIEAFCLTKEQFIRIITKQVDILERNILRHEEKIVLILATNNLDQIGQQKRIQHLGSSVKEMLQAKNDSVLCELA
jgi:hypothetical protein